MRDFPVLTILPLTATIIAAAFSIVIFNHYLGTRRRPHEFVWGIAFLLFAVAAACQVYADLAGTWTPFAARLYYLTGAILNVGYLGLGTLYLLSPRRLAHLASLEMIMISVVSTAVVFTVPIEPALLAQEAGWKAVAVLSPEPRWFAIVINSLGTILVVGGALWSGLVFWRKRIMKQRMIGVFLIAAGAFVIALGGTITGLTGLRNHDYLYITMAVGVVMMFVGYLQTIRPAPVASGQVVEPKSAAPRQLGQ